MKDGNNSWGVFRRDSWHSMFRGKCHKTVMFFANAAAVSTTSVTKPHMYQPNIKVMFNRVNQH